MTTNIFILIAIILISCAGNKKNQQSDTFTVKVIDLLSEPDSKLVNISDIASDVKYIPLETTENCMIRSVNKVIACKDKIYLKNVHEILCFNNQGKFLFRLSNSGRGPQEYVYIVDFDISSDGNMLIILDTYKILEYNIKGDGFVYLKSINLKQPSPSKLDMVPGTNNIMLSIGPYSGSEPSLSILLKINGDTLNYKPNIYKYEKVDKVSWMATNETLQYKIENSLCFKEEFSDTVFSITSKSNNFIPRLIFDSHGKIYHPRARGDREYALSHLDQMSRVYDIIEVPRYIIYSYEYNRSRYKILYDKSVNKKFEMKLKNALTDNISGGSKLDPEFCSDGKFYSSIDAIKLKNYVTSEEFTKASVQVPKKKEELKALADKLKETDNPVLIVVTPKK